MAQICLLISLLTLTIPHLFLSGVVASATFTILNKCDHTVWPGILSNAGIAPLSTTGLALRHGESKTINVPSSWGGRFWGRTHCSEDSDGKFACVTGDCGSGKVECAGGNAAPPATLAEFTLDGSGGLDFYDVSLVDGYNLPMLVVPQGGTGVNCTTTGCVVDLNGSCPSELKVKSNGGESVACKSACEAFGQAQYCCSGAYATPDTCKPSAYSELFKSACPHLSHPPVSIIGVWDRRVGQNFWHRGSGPHAYSYAYDDKTSTFTCANADYLITFCPLPNTSQKSSEVQNPVASNSSVINSTMVYEGVLDSSGAPSCTHVFRSQAITGGVAIVAAIWLWRQHF